MCGERERNGMEWTDGDDGDDDDVVTRDERATVRRDVHHTPLAYRRVVR